MTSDRMTSALAFYWICAGFATIDTARAPYGIGVEVACSLIFGGFVLPVKILANLAMQTRKS